MVSLYHFCRVQISNKFLRIARDLHVPSCDKNQTRGSLSVQQQLNTTYKEILGNKHYYRMVGNFREVFIFMFFASREPFAKIKTAKILLPTCKANEPRFNPWPTSMQPPTKACQRVCL